MLGWHSWCIINFGKYMSIHMSQLAIIFFFYFCVFTITAHFSSFIPLSVRLTFFFSIYTPFKFGFSDPLVQISLIYERKWETNKLCICGYISIYINILPDINYLPFTLRILFKSSGTYEYKCFEISPEIGFIKVRNLEFD